MTDNRARSIEIVNRIGNRHDGQDDPVEFSNDMLASFIAEIEGLLDAKDAAERRAEEARDLALEEAAIVAEESVLIFMAQPITNAIATEIANSQRQLSAEKIRSLRANPKQPEAVGHPITEAMLERAIAAFRLPTLRIDDAVRREIVVPIIQAALQTTSYDVLSAEVVGACLDERQLGFVAEQDPTRANIASHKAAVVRRITAVEALAFKPTGADGAMR